MFNEITSKGWNVSEERRPMDLLLYSDNRETVTHVERVLLEASLKNRMVIAKSQTEAITYVEVTVSRRGSSSLPVPGLIILDLKANEGYGLLRQLRTTNSLMAIPIVVVTDELSEANLKYINSHGVTGRFTSPINPSSMRKTVRDVEDHWNLLANAPCAN